MVGKVKKTGIRQRQNEDEKVAEQLRKLQKRKEKVHDNPVILRFRGLKSKNRN